MLSDFDQRFLRYFRGLAILLIIAGHLAGWVWRPYSTFITVSVPFFFLISGAVSFESFHRAACTSKYLLKRVVGLLVPYYLVACFAYIYFILNTKTFPVFTLENLLAWLLLVPRNDLMPFPLGQIWFLHTLLLMIFVSPLFYNLFLNKKKILGVIIFSLLILSCVQLFVDIHHTFTISMLGMTHNIYKPLIHSIFFIYGFVYFNTLQFWTIRKEVCFSCLILLIAIGIVFYFGLDIDLTYHTFSPDFYYVLCSIFSISVVLIIRKFAVVVIEKLFVIRNILLFCDKHTFSIFLLHLFAVYVAENTFGLVHPVEKTVLYAIKKVGVVLVVTVLLSIPFTKLSGFVVSSIKDKLRIF